MRFMILLLCLTTALPLCAKEVYKWTSEDGVVQYSDTYRPGATRVTVTEGQLVGGDQAAGKPASDSDGTAEAADYISLEVTKPQPDATVRSNEGTVEVNLALKPTLLPKHALRIKLDGKPQGQVKTTSFSLKQLNRGTHTLQFEVVDEQGKTLISSEPVRFHLRKASIIKP